jgi:nicotinate-nucleotide--dimethylbenzimidazole phosphoribosyltransferase
MTLTPAEIARALDAKTKPIGSLGRLEGLAAQIAARTGTLRPRLERCTLLLFAGDHGIAAEGVSAYPQAVTRQMLLNFLGGGAAANVFARTVGASVRIVDAGVAGEPVAHPDLLSLRIGPGTRSFARGPAMTEPERDRALAAGRELGHTEAADVLCFGEMGIGNTSAAALLGHKLIGATLDLLVGPGTGVAGEALGRKREVLARAAARTPDRLDANVALAEYGGFEIVAMVGAMLGGAAAGRLLLVDGFIATAAALAAVRLDPDVRGAMIFAHRSAEPGHQALLDALGAEPLLDLGLRLGEGTGALLAWPLLRAAADMLRDMATFDGAGVSGPA